MTTQQAPAPPIGAADERVRSVGTVTRLLTRPEFGAIIAAVVVWVFFAVVAYDNNFVSWATTAAILNRATPLGILAVAVALLMIAGEFDLSVGSLIGFSGHGDHAAGHPGAARAASGGRSARRWSPPWPSLLPPASSTGCWW